MTPLNRKKQRHLARYAWSIDEDIGWLAGRNSACRFALPGSGLRNLPAILHLAHPRFRKVEETRFSLFFTDRF